MADKPDTAAPDSVEPDSVDAYIASFPDGVRPLLAAVRSAILSAAPGATESISYGMPTVTLDDRRLLYFAGWTKHVALYAIGTLSPELETDLRPFRVHKDTVRFPVGRAVPEDLVRRVTIALIAARST